MPPKVSVMMTTYNHEEFIGQAVASVLEQETDFDFEILVGEDCSTDRTREILVDLQATSPRELRLLLRNHNWGGRRNLMDTFMSCSGEYIALLEGDDFWTDPLKLQKQVDLLDSHRELSVCFHRVLKRHETSGRETLAPAGEPAADRFTMSDLLRNNFIPTCSVMFRNGLFREFPSWFRTTPSGDWPLHILNALHGDIGYINEVMAVYRLHSGGVWSVRSPAEQKQRSVQTLEILRQNLDPRHERELALNLARWRIRLLFSIARERGSRAAMCRAPDLLMSSDMPKSTILKAGLGLVWTRMLGALGFRPPAGLVL